MRRRVVARTGPDGVPPPELLIGGLVEVWASEDCGEWPPRFSAHRRHRAACRAWAAEQGVTDRELYRLLPGGQSWSVQGLPRVEAVERLARAGVTIDDLPRLRADAARLYPADPAARP